MISRDKSGDVLGRWEKAQRNKIPAVSRSPWRNSVKSPVCRPGRVKEKIEGGEGHPENKLSICPVQNTLPGSSSSVFTSACCWAHGTICITDSRLRNRTLSFKPDMKNVLES